MSGITVLIRKPTWSTSSCPACGPRSIPIISGSKPSAASATFSDPMFDRLRQSLALKLAALYTVVFVIGAAALFGVLYWSLANALDARERAALERRVQEFSTTFERGGASGLIARIKNDTSPEMG